MSDDEGLVPVEIAGLRYAIRTELAPEYVARLAAYVDEKIRAAADLSPSGDPVRLAVLAALNVADELFRCRDAHLARTGQIAERAQELEQMIDSLLMT